jgi:hypothetical protein
MGLYNFFLAISFNRRFSYYSEALSLTKALHQPNWLTSPHHHPPESTISSTRSPAPSGCFS